MTLLLRRPNHLQSDETLSVSFVSHVRWPMKRPVPKKVLKCLAVSESLRAMLRMADEAPEAAPKKALAVPIIRRPGGLREALD